MTSFPSFHSSGLRRGCLWLLQQTMGTTYRPFRCSSRRTRWAVKLYRNTHVRICWTIKPLRSVFLVISLRPSFQTQHHCYSSCVTHTSTTSCFFFHSDPAEGDPGTPATLRWHLRAQREHRDGGHPERGGYQSTSRWATGPLEPPHPGDSEAARAAGGGPSGAAVLLRRGRGGGLDERTGALHDVRGES